ncbi:SOS response-associated peptidase [Companilactobacillus halodurans]|uniref:Abasic site processing protein n=1 Tax=Companilactobacillus halodurans TaxID=2584183 RepID=A0A5P0ZNH4_9LACO|nr:SOS response-associated peptidase family protein [Companilactobacillus halodurans]MQS75391.1 SOS response-associated peptidase [Companilactobacillus halodurans]MQS97336.1 SOS response-associated peptidase [Companilactobacillus halodurans]
MCGRYLFQPDKNPEIKRIYQLAVDNGFQPKTGEIFPTDQTALIVAGKRQVQVVTMKWGFPGFKPGQSIINARFETASQKQMFADSFQKRRCVYPTTGFFEWNKQKQKYKFNFSNDPQTLFIGGCYNYFDDVPQSVLFTTEPNESMIQIHDRMPLILAKNQINAWIYDDKFANSFMDQTMPKLISQEEK